MKCKNCGQDVTKHICPELYLGDEGETFDPETAHDEALAKAKELDRAVNPEADPEVKP